MLSLNASPQPQAKAASGPLFLPPANFQRAGEVSWAEFRRESPFGPTPRGRPVGAKGAGVSFERRVHKALLSRFSEPSGVYVPAPWIAFVTRNSPRLRFAQPDALLLDLSRGHITIVEVKLRHTQAAWFSLRWLYEPLLRTIYGNSWSYSVLELCKWYDAHMPWPEPFKLVKDPLALARNEFGIHIWSE